MAKALSFPPKGARKPDPSPSPLATQQELLERITLLESQVHKLEDIHRWELKGEI